MLIIVFRALLPAVLPLITSLIGVGVGVAGSLAFSGVVDMSSVTPVLGVMLGLAVGIDYALFIMNRHRRQVLSGMELHESIGLANGTSGNAVVFAGSTVLIALLALNVTGIPFLGVMGTVGAVCVLIAVLIAVSLTPALLGLIGPRVLSRRARREIGHEAHARARAAPDEDLARHRARGPRDRRPRRHRHPRAVDAPRPARRLIRGRGLDAVPRVHRRRRRVRRGQNGSLLVVAELPEPVADDEVVATQADLAETLMAQTGVVAVAPVGVSDDNDYFAFQVVPADGPSSESTEQLVHDLRDLSPLEGDITLGVAGQASGNIDISDKLAGVLPLYLGVVVGLSLIILILVFRSILVPLIATAGFVLTLFAAFGAVVAIFQWGWLGRGVRRARSRPRAELRADHHHGRAVRAGHGLPALPRLGHARGLRARRARPHRGRRRPAERPSRGHGRGDHHGRGVRRLRVLAPRRWCGRSDSASRSAC